MLVVPMEGQEVGRAKPLYCIVFFLLKTEVEWLGCWIAQLGFMVTVEILKVHSASLYSLDTSRSFKATVYAICKLPPNQYIIICTPSSQLLSNRRIKAERGREKYREREHVQLEKFCLNRINCFLLFIRWSLQWHGKFPPIYVYLYIYISTVLCLNIKQLDTICIRSAKKAFSKPWTRIQDLNGLKNRRGQIPMCWTCCCSFIHLKLLQFNYKRRKKNITVSYRGRCLQILTQTTEYIIFSFLIHLLGSSLMKWLALEYVVMW